MIILKIGFRIKLKTDGEKKPTRKQTIKNEDEFIEEVDSDEEECRMKQHDTEGTHITKVDNNSDKCDNVEQSREKSTKVEISESLSRAEETCDMSKKPLKTRPKKMYGPLRPPDNYVMPEDYFNQESDRDLPEIMEAE